MQRTIAFERTVGVDFDAAADVLRHGLAEFVCDDPQTRTFTVHAEIAGFDVARDVVVRLGEPRDVDEHSIVVPLGWEASEHPGRFPTVTGFLELSALAHHPPVSQMGFFGDVEVPLGILGTIGEAMGGRRVADDVLERVVHRFAARLSIAVAEGSAAQADRTAAQHRSRPGVVLPRD